MQACQQKRTGAYYTPESVARRLVRWVVRHDSDRLLDPACGDGRFLRQFANSVGVEQDAEAARLVHAASPGSLLHQGDFFAWAAQTHERFECVAGNPPFIRYQRFSGEVRAAALNLCARLGVRFTALCSSWAPFVVAGASLLRPGGRLAFVVPAEIGHAPYARPVMEYLAGHFGEVCLVAVRDKLFPDLSEDCWLLYAAGFGDQTDRFALQPVARFAGADEPPRGTVTVSLRDWRAWGGRLRPFLLPAAARAAYLTAATALDAWRLGEVAQVGIGYVSGDNEFFHLRPSVAHGLGVPEALLQPTVRTGRGLTRPAIRAGDVARWRAADEPNFLLRLTGATDLPAPVRRYLDSEPGQKARQAYKCRQREPWYAVPDVVVPDAFLTYMSGATPHLAANLAGCTGTNALHMVRMKPGVTVTELQARWRQPLTELSCEIEGHPLGGGMLKLEPREASRVLLADPATADPEVAAVVVEGVATLRQWRHHG